MRRNILLEAQPKRPQGSKKTHTTVQTGEVSLPVEQNGSTRYQATSRRLNTKP